MKTAQQWIDVIDSHTAGEPTRVITSGGPDLGSGSVAEKLERFKREHDRFRPAVVNEPRGSDVMVGGMLVEPNDSRCSAGVIFFNNVGFLGMCGHGMIGVITTLAHSGRIKPGTHAIETPVGIVSATLQDTGEVSIENVPCYRMAKNVEIDVAGIGRVRGDVAWGGNWFFLVDDHGLALTLENLDRLMEYTWALRQAVNFQGYPKVDHVELMEAGARDKANAKPQAAPHPNSPPEYQGRGQEANARNFVLCPGKAYDRSPCGTGTSAKIACLAEDGNLKEGEIWIQEGILGTRFNGRYRREGSQIIPTITGKAFITGEARLCLDEDDPFRWGICDKERT